MEQPKKQRKSRPMAFHAAGLLSPRRRTSLVHRMVKGSCGTGPISFPPDFSRVKKVLIIMPEDTVEAFHQTLTIMSLFSLFKGAAVTFFCERDALGFFRNMAEVSAIVEYAQEDRYLFSPVFKQHMQTFAQEGFDVCILLEKSPDLSLLQLVGATGAVYRIGYFSETARSFLNYQVRLAEKVKYLSESNFALARNLGGPVPRPMRWVVSREAQDEVRHHLHEHKIDGSRPLAGVDGFLLQALYGNEWTSRFIKELAGKADAVFYAVAGRSSQPEISLWLEQQGLRVLPGMAISRLAALAGFSAVLVCGNSVLFHLAQMLQRPAVVLIDSSVLDLYFRPADHLAAVTFAGTPDHDAVRSACELAAAAVRSAVVRTATAPAPRTTAKP